MDVLTKEQRSKNMRAIKAQNTKIEVKLSKILWKKGYRYRRNVKSIMGKPDIAFIGLKIAIFCDSEFWHGKDWDKEKHRIKSNKEFWYNKIEQNMLRDIEVNKNLNEKGWVILRFWGKEINKDIESCVLKIEEVINERKSIKIYSNKGKNKV